MTLNALLKTKIILAYLLSALSFNQSLLGISIMNNAKGPIKCKIDIRGHLVASAELGVGKEATWSPRSSSACWHEACQLSCKYDLPGSEDEEGALIITPDILDDNYQAIPLLKTNPQKSDSNLSINPLKKTSIKELAK